VIRFWEKMSSYEISKKQLKKAKIPAKVGKKALFASFSEGGIMPVEIKKVKKKSVIVTPCKCI